MFTLEGYWRNLLFFICKPIYKLIVVFYELFNVVGTADILDSEVLNVLYTRIGTILGVYMMFRIIFSFIQMLINPDYISDKEKGVGKIVSKVVLTILLMGITPYIFSKAMELQNFIVGINSDNGNIIAKIILPNQDASSYDRFGADLSAYLFTSFYQFAEDAPADARASCSLAYNNWTVLKNAIVVGEGNINSAKLCLDNSFTNGDKEDSYVIDFTSNGLFAVIVGGIVCYILIIYTLMASVRVVQLAFLRIISPMAILTFLSPKKDTMFSKWLKMVTTTYVDLFIRMAIIYFVIFIITLIMGSDSGVALAVDDYDGPMWVVNIVMILALLFFAKKAPELLKELFPSSGVGSLGFGLKSPKGLLGGMLLGGALTKGYDKLAGIAKTAPKRAFAGATTGVAGLVQGAASRGMHIRRNWNNSNGRQRAGMIFGALGGAGMTMLRGMGSGLASGKTGQSLSKQRERIGKFDTWSQSGGRSTVRRAASNVLGRVNPNLTQGQKDKMTLQGLQDFAKIQSSMKDSLGRVKVVKDAREDLQKLVDSGASTAQITMAQQYVDSLEKGFLKAAYNGPDQNGNVGFTDSLGNYIDLNDQNDSNYSNYQSFMTEIGVYRDNATTIAASNDRINGNAAADTYDGFKQQVADASTEAIVFENSAGYKAGQANDAYNGNTGKK